VYQGSFFPTSSPTHVVGCVLMMAILTGVRWNLRVVLIYISFMARDGKHFFLCFLAIWISSFQKVLLSSVAHFLIGSLIWGEFSFLSSLYILQPNFFKECLPTTFQNTSKIQKYYTTKELQGTLLYSELKIHYILLFTWLIFLCHSY
jgi:hypothetical protein